MIIYLQEQWPRQLMAKQTKYLRWLLLSGPGEYDLVVLCQQIYQDTVVATML